MRLAFFGSGGFGIATLRELLERGNEIAAVISQPDRPAGRGGGARPTPVAALARELGIPLVLTPENPNRPEFVARLTASRPDLAVIVAYGHLIGKALLDALPLGFVNLHASLLPAYRGAAPVPWAILNGERESGVSVFQLDERFDTGAVLGEAALPILDDDTSGTYLERLAPVGARLMADVTADIGAGRAAPREQDHSRASSAPKMRKEDGRVNWELDRARIDRMVRAFQPWPRAFGLFRTPKGEVRVNILSVAASDLPAEGRRPGDVLAADARLGLVVMAGDGPIRLRDVQPEGRLRMADTEFMKGAKIIQ